MFNHLDERVGAGYENHHQKSNVREWRIVKAYVVAWKGDATVRQYCLSWREYVG